MEVIHDIIKSAYDAGLNDRQISEKTGYCMYTVFNWRQKNKLCANGRLDNKKCIKLYECGLDDNSIAKKLNVHVSTIRRWRKKNGLINNIKKEDTTTKVCRSLHTSREYGKRATRHKSVSIKFDEDENGRNISCVCGVTLNIITGNIVIVSGIVYRRKTIHPTQQPGKYNCYTDRAIDMYNHKKEVKKSHYSPEKRREYYLKSKTRGI